ncbi:MAG: hypothetical protein U9Q78_02380 [Chloroflexota bacterium]|nr:hypothetical protein [Chloroflexota bacterium]
MEKGVHLRAKFWDDLVRRDVKVDPDNGTLTVVAIHDPRFIDPLLLACPVELSIHRACSEPLSGKALYGLYRNRWPVEQVPLAAKQMLGGERQPVLPAPDQAQVARVRFRSGESTTTSRVGVVGRGNHHLSSSQLTGDADWFLESEPACGRQAEAHAGAAAPGAGRSTFSLATCA